MCTLKLSYEVCIIICIITNYILIILFGPDNARARQVLNLFSGDTDSRRATVAVIFYHMRRTHHVTRRLSGCFCTFLSLYVTNPSCTVFRFCRVSISFVFSQRYFILADALSYGRMCVIECEWGCDILILRLRLPTDVIPRVVVRFRHRHCRVVIRKYVAVISAFAHTYVLCCYCLLKSVRVTWIVGNSS